MWYPYDDYFGFVKNIFLIFFQGYATLFPSFDKVAFIVLYILIPVFFILFFFRYKFWIKTEWVGASEIDIWSHRCVIIEEKISATNRTIWSRIKAIFM
jgi:amino acid permease